MAFQFCKSVSITAIIALSTFATASSVAAQVLSTTSSSPSTDYNKLQQRFLLASPKSFSMNNEVKFSVSCFNSNNKTNECPTESLTTSEQVRDSGNFQPQSIYINPAVFNQSRK